MYFATQVNLLQSFTTISLFIGIFGIAGGVFSFLRFNNYQETVKLQNDNIRALKEQADLHEKQITQQSQEIQKLLTRNDVIESLPLKEILSSLQLIHKDVVLLAKMPARNGK